MKKIRAKKSGVRFLVCLVVILMVTSGFGIWYLGQKNFSVSFTPVAFTLSNEQLNNPYCGWFHTYDYQVNQDTVFEETSVAEAVKEDVNSRLCQVKIDLGAYASGQLPAEAIDTIGGILGAWSATDKQMLLGFYYSAVPEQMETVYLHMEQLAPLINERKSHIYAYQCLGTQNTRAMTESPLFQGESLKELIAYQASMMDETMILTVDNVNRYEALTGFLNLPSQDMAFTGTLPARLGIFSSDINREKSKAEKQALLKLGTCVPVGGVAASEGDMASVAEEGVTFLCADESVAVEAWKNETYPGEDAFSGLTMYDYLTTHLGYRYIFQDAEVTFDNWKDEKAKMRIHLQNIGFSNAYRVFDTSLLLKNTKTEEVISIPLDEDNRRWLSGQDVTVETELDIKSYDKGTYHIYFMMVDTKSGDVIRFGNTMSLGNNGYQLGVMEIQ